MYKCILSFKDKQTGKVYFADNHITTSSYIALSAQSRKYFIPIGNAIQQNDLPEPAQSNTDNYSSDFLGLFTDMSFTDTSNDNQSTDTSDFGGFDGGSGGGGGATGDWS